MIFFSIIFTLLSVCTIALSLLKPKYGALSYLIYMFFAPYLYIAGYIIYARTLAFLFLFFTLLLSKKSITKNKLKPLFPYITFLIWNLFFVINSEHFEYSFSYWLTNVSALFFIVFLYANMCNDINAIRLYKWTLFGICCVFTLYGIYLTTMPGLNPYQLLTAPMFGGEFNEAYAAGNSALSENTNLAEGRLYGRISSVFAHPMTYGLNLGFFFIYSIYLLKDNRKFLICVLLVILYAIFTSGIRTPIAALAVTLLAILLYMRSIKIFIVGLIAFLFIIYMLPIISPDSSEFIMSIINSNESVTSGSSLEMRLEQLEGGLEIIKDDLLFGKGYEWTHWYNNNIGMHQKCLWFESLIVSILVNTGFMGFILWGWFFIKYYKVAQTDIKDKQLRMCVLALFFYFFAYCSITGDFQIKNMYVFFIVLIGINKEKFNSFYSISCQK